MQQLMGVVCVVHPKTIGEIEIEPELLTTRRHHLTIGCGLLRCYSVFLS